VDSSIGKPVIKVLSGDTALRKERDHGLRAWSEKGRIHLGHGVVR